MSGTASGMIGRGKRARVDPAFDRFLQASFEEGRPEQLPTVLSVLARLGLDPWQEAAELAALSPAAATDRLALHVAAVPNPGPDPRDARQIASRLVRLLPAPGRADVPEEGAEDPTQPLQRELGIAGRRGLGIGIVILLLVLGAVSMLNGIELGGLLGYGAAGPGAGASSLGVAGD